MSNASQLKAGDSLCDPFCGVGGFVLEAIAENDNLAKQFEPVNGKVNPAITFRGYDKGTDEKEDERTIILAKANMLVYLSDILAKYPSHAHMREFARAFNDVFRLLRSNLGTFGQLESDEHYDLILTNPPYVTSGTSSIRSAIESQGLGNYYAVGGRGTESLAIQWIVGHLKSGGSALMVVPDGLLNQSTMIDYIKSTCRILAIVALPSRTFYSTPKKTYILAVERKAEGEGNQSLPVFSYLVSEIGESRDTRRVRIGDQALFSISIGERVLIANHVTAGIPAYSANALVPFGYVQSSNLSDFEEPSILWGIDGNFDINFVPAGVAFATTDHCGRLQIIDETIDPDFVYWSLRATRERYGFDRVFRASLTNVSAEVEVTIPINPNTEIFDIGAQRAMAGRMRALYEARAAVDLAFGELMRGRIRIEDLSL